MANDERSTIKIIFDGTATGVVKAAAVAGAAIKGVSKAFAALGAAGAGLNVVSGIATVLGQIAPVGLLLPGIMLGAAAAITTFKVAMSGFADAVGGDAEAMAKLPPNARQAATAVKALQTAFEDVRKAVQQKFFEGFAADVKQIGTVFLPTLKAGMVDVAGAFAEVRAASVKAFATPEGAEDLGNIFANVATSIRGSGAALGDFAAGFLQLGSIGSEFLPGLTAGLDGLAAKFRAFVEDNPKRVHDMIAGALSAIGQLFTILGNVGAIIGSIFRGLAADFGSPLDSLEALTGKLRAFFESAAAQGPLQALGETLRLVSSVIGDVLVAGLKAVGPVITAIMPLVSALATAIGETLVGVFEAFAPTLEVVAGALSNALAPVLPVISAALVGLAQAIAPVISALAGPFAQIVGTLALLFAQLVVAITPVIAALGPIVAMIGQALAEALSIAAPLIVQVATTLSGFLVEALNALMPLLPPLIDAWMQVWAAALQLIPPILDLATNVFPAVIAIIGVVIQIIIQMLPVWVSIITTVIQVAAAIIQFVADVIGAIGPFVTSVIEFFTNLKTNVTNTINQMITLVVRFFIDMVTNIVTTVSGWVDTVSTFVSDMKTAVSNFVSDMVQAVIRFFENMKTDAGQAVKTLVDDAIAAVGRMVTGFIDAAGRAVDGMVQGIRDGIGRVGQAAKDLAQGAWDAVTGFFETGSPSKLFRKGGRWAGDGLALGFEDSFSNVIASAARMAQLAAEAGQVTIAAPIITAGALGSPTLAATATSSGTADLVDEVIRRLGGAGGQGASPIELRVFIGDRELTDIVRTEVDTKDAQTASLARAGTGVTF